MLMYILFQYRQSIMDTATVQMMSPELGVPAQLNVASQQHVRTNRRNVHRVKVSSMISERPVSLVDAAKQVHIIEQNKNNILCFLQF